MSCHSQTAPRAASARTIAGWLGGEVRGDGGRMIADVAALADAGPEDISYCESVDRIAEAAASEAGCLIVPEDADVSAIEDRPTISHTAPQAAFVDVMLRFRPPRQRPEPAVSLDAWVAPSAKLGEDVSVAPHAYIGADARVGDRTVVHPNATVMDGAAIGEDCVLHPGVVVSADCVVGDRVMLHPNAVIGADGFGYRFEGGAFEKLPHTGRTIVEDDVEVGACTTVDRGMVGDTVVGAGTKIDNQVQIAHNVRVGRHNALAAHVGIAGSSKTGDYVRMGGQAGVADHVTIGSGVSLGAKCAVASDVADGQTMHGVPARPAREQMRILSASARLPDMRRQIRELEGRLKELEQGAARRAA